MNQAPTCPHVTAAGRPTCREPMVSRGPGHWECANDHSGPRIKLRDPEPFPDLPRYTSTGVR